MESYPNKKTSGEEETITDRDELLSLNYTRDEWMDGWMDDEVEQRRIILAR